MQIDYSCRFYAVNHAQVNVRAMMIMHSCLISPYCFSATSSRYSCAITAEVLHVQNTAWEYWILPYEFLYSKHGLIQYSPPVSLSTA